MLEEFGSQRVIVGAVGHVDHGKSTLAAAIAAVQSRMGLAGECSFAEISKAETAQEWGISMTRVLVEYRTQRRSYLHLDCPGHADYVKCLVAGALHLDGTLLVVSAADGPMTHTRDQLLLLRRIGVPVSAVFLNKVDAVGDDELITRVEEEVRDLLAECGYDGKRIIVVQGSALRALQEPGNREMTGPIDELLAALDEMIPHKSPEGEKPFLFPIESVYFDEERGVVGIGTVERGTVGVGDAVDRVGLQEPKRMTVTGIEKSLRKQNRAEAGDLVELFFRGAAREELERGMVLAATGSVSASNRFRAVVYLIDRGEGGRQEAVRDKWMPRFLIRTAEVDGWVILPEGRESIEPGDHAEFQVELGLPAVLETKQRFGIKETGRIVGAGVVAEVLH